MNRRRRSKIGGPTDRTGPLRVLHVFSELRYSGGEVRMRVASDLWPQYGIECEIVAVADVVGPYARTLESVGYRVHRLSPSPLRLLITFPRLLRTVKPHIVHIHVERANFWLGLEAIGSRAQVVQEVHNCFPFTGALRVERTIQRRILSKLGARYAAISPSVGVHERIAFHNATEIIWNWCDLETFSQTGDADRESARRELGLQREDQVLVSVGNCSDVKNHESILRAIAATSTPSNVVYLHAGDHSDPSGDAECKLALSLGIGARVRFLGAVEDVRQVLRAADLFVMPSHYEGLGMSAVEAVATGTPTLVSSVPGLRDLAALSDAIDTVEAEPIALSEAIGRVLARKDRDQRSRALRTTAERWFSPERGVAQYADLYRSSDGASAASFVSVEPATISALITCHNRREHTMACLDSLLATTIPGVSIDVHLVDDASDDGTSEAVAKAYPDVEITRGSGELYWGGGMRLAFGRATASCPDYLLWLNDDVILDPDAVNRLLTTYASRCAERQVLSIIVGAVRDPMTGATTYGGVRRTSRLRRMAFAQVTPTDVSQPCDTMNGNVVLIPRSVYSIVGNIDERFTHAMGDLDYGLRARSVGCQVSLAPGYVGTCTGNPPADTFRDPALTRRQRLRRAASPKGLPVAEWSALCRRHGGPLWPALALSPYVRIIAGRRQR
jgi:GT2 family glycosyltransferase/glycosyltransferase involved in cell wall biosynthesis